MIDGMTDTSKDIMIAHNLRSFDVNQMSRAFIENDGYRRFPARVRWYHEVLSFSPLDKENINSVMLEDIARQYINLRNPHALCFAVAHTDKAHTHLHFCFSGTEYRSKTTLRMDDPTFEALRYDIERYQMDKYPQLENSIVYWNKERKRNPAKVRDKNTRAEKEYQTKRRLKNQLTQKEQLKQVVLDAYNQAQSVDGFHGLVEQSGLTLNFRNGKINGVKGKRTYRFSTLGVSKQMLQSLNKLQNRWEDIDALKNTSQSPDRER